MAIVHGATHGLRILWGVRPGFGPTDPQGSSDGRLADAHRDKLTDLAGPKAHGR